MKGGPFGFFFESLRIPKKKQIPFSLARYCVTRKKTKNLSGSALECIGKLNLLKAQFCAFNTSDSTTIPLTVQN